MHPRDFRFHRPKQGEICISGIVRIDAALHTHLGGATVPGLARPARYFCVREVIRISPQLLAQFSLRESAEAAFEGAYVRVVDIAIDDITNHIAALTLTQFVGIFANGIEISGTSGKHCDDVILRQAAARQGTANYLFDRVRRTRALSVLRNWTY